MTDQELIFKLKRWGSLEALLAADRIEELEKEQARLHAGWHEANVSGLDAKLKLAKAVEALRYYADASPVARAVLAELEGK